MCCKFSPSVLIFVRTIFFFWSLRYTISRHDSVPHRVFRGITHLLTPEDSNMLSAVHSLLTVGHLHSPLIVEFDQSNQYQLLCTVLHDIEGYEEPVSRTEKIPHHAAKFETCEFVLNVGYFEKYITWPWLVVLLILCPCRKHWPIQQRVRITKPVES